jgi:aminoglycoside 3-N-acetyltransferase I
MRAQRLTSADRVVAKELFVLMAKVFEEDREPLGDAYLDRLLSREGFWAIAAFTGEGELVGGLTAHTLPMTRAEASEIFIYDIAVRTDHQRKGVGRLLVTTLRNEAASLGIEDVFVPADEEDAHALDFYRALGGVESPVRFFTFFGPEGR